MAIGFARLEFVKRSQGKNAVCKAAYLERCMLQFEGTKFQATGVYSWAHLEKPIFSSVYLPEHVDVKFKEAGTLWNAVEKFEKRKDSQVGLDIVLSLPDDKTISLEDRIALMEKFTQAHFVSKGYGVHAVIHAPDNKNARVSETSGKLEKIDHNWHCHLFITPRTFNERGDNFNSKKLLDLFPSIRGATHFAVDAIKWGKVWTQIQNDYFEEKGLTLRVDHEGVIPQNHLGPVRMRGSKLYAELERQDQKIAMNQMLSKNPSLVLEQLTKMASVFTIEDAENYFRKHLHENDIPTVREEFWKHQTIVELFKIEKELVIAPQPTRKFSTVAVVEEEKKILRLAGRMQMREALKCRTLKPMEEFKKGLNDEQKIAFDATISGRALSCIEGHAGTGKSYLLVALKKFYEGNGYTVRAFGPDNATVRVLQEKGFDKTMNTHQFLFSNYFAKGDIFSGNEVWIVDEAGKLANRPLLELLKQAEKSGAQLIFSGNSAQLSSVERGGMFKKFCGKYGCTFLFNVQRQNDPRQRNISRTLAIGNSSLAIDMIAVRGGFIWSDSKETAISSLIEKWMIDRSHHPYSSQLIIAQSNAEVRHINEIIHFYRKKGGEIASKEFECQTSFGKINVSEGDLIEFRKNDPALGVSNGLMAVLVSASEKQFVVKTQGEEKGRLITFDPCKYSSFHLGYATTNFRSQGRTIDRAYVLYSGRINKPLFYVALTRHVRNAHCFVSRTEARFLSDIKFQANRLDVKESASEYMTFADIKQQKRYKEMERRIETLGKSEHLLDRVKGGYLKTWAGVKSQLFGLIEKMQDRRDSLTFYKVDISPSSEQFGQVEIKEEESTWNGLQEIVQIDEQKLGKSQLPSEQGIARPVKSKSLQLSENQKILLSGYYEKVNEASLFYNIVKSETEDLKIEERQSNAFSKWQMACKGRNKAAHQLFQTFSPGNLRELIGAKPFEILKDRMEKHEQQLAPKINICDLLKENLEPLLYRLFPEGPSRKDSRGFRFGAKGSLAVTCKGDKMGCYFDFENQKGGSVLQLIQMKLELNELETKEWAHNFLNAPAAHHFPKQYSTAIFNKSEVKEWIRSIAPKGHICPELPEISKHLAEKYTLVTKHPYYDGNNNLLLYILRLQGKENPKDKMIQPLSYGRANQSLSDLHWGLKRGAFQNGKYPIYNNQLLKENPGKPVLIVEGEKSADAGSLMFDHMVTVSWLGGSGTAKKADWSSLFGRDVTIWPDNDSAGLKAADEIGASLRQVGVRSLNVVDLSLLDKEFPEKWDIADPLPPGKDQKFLNDAFQRAEPKAVGIDRLSAFLNLAGKNDKDLLEVQRLNEIVWRVDGRMRSDLEKECKSKPWEIENRIISEVSSILSHHADLIKMTRTLSGHQGMVEGIAFQGMLHQARTGTLPTLDRLEEIKKTMIDCCSTINQTSQRDEKAYTYALDKTCAIAIENRLQDKAKINEHFQAYITETVSLQNEETVPSKTKIMQIQY